MIIFECLTVEEKLESTGSKIFFLSFILNLMYKMASIKEKVNYKHIYHVIVPTHKDLAVYALINFFNQIYNMDFEIVYILKFPTFKSSYLILKGN